MALEERMVLTVESVPGQVKDILGKCPFRCQNDVVLLCDPPDRSGNQLGGQIWSI